MPSRAAPGCAAFDEASGAFDPLSTRARLTVHEA
jgi:hypothetical protein